MNYTPKNLPELFQKRNGLAITEECRREVTEIIENMIAHEHGMAPAEVRTRGLSASYGAYLEERQRSMKKMHLHKTPE